MHRSALILILSAAIALGQGIGPIGGGHGSVKSVTYNNPGSPEIHGTVSDPSMTPVITLEINSNAIIADKLTLTTDHRLLGRKDSTGNGQEIQIGEALDWISNTTGSLLYRGNTTWSALGPPVGINILTYNSGVAWEARSDFQLSSEKNQANGYPGLDGSGKLDSSRLPAGVEMTANKGAVSGYAPLDSSQHVPTTNLGTGATGGGTKALFDDHVFRAVAGGGSILDVAVATANGVSGVSNHDATTPTITLTLGAITPTSIVASGTVAGSNLSGTNTGDQTITLTGAVTGTGTGSFATTLTAHGVTYAKMQQAVSGYRLLGNPTSSAADFAEVPVEASQFSSGTLKTYAPSASVSGSSPHADAATTKTFYITLSANATFVFDNFGDGDSIAVRVRQAHTGGPYTVAFPTSNWQGGSQPVQTVTADKADWYMFQKTNVGIDAKADQNF